MSKLSIEINNWRITYATAFPIKTLTERVRHWNYTKRGLIFSYIKYFSAFLFLPPLVYLLINECVNKCHCFIYSAEQLNRLTTKNRLAMNRSTMKRSIKRIMMVKTNTFSSNNFLYELMEYFLTETEKILTPPCCIQINIFISKKKIVNKCDVDELKPNDQ